MLDEMTGATEAVEQTQMDSQAAEVDETETSEETIPAQGDTKDGAERVESDDGRSGGDGEQVTISKEVYDNMLSLMAGGGQAPQQTPQESPVPESHPQQNLEPPAFFNMDENTFNQALRDPQSFSQVMNESMLGAISSALSMYEQRNQRNIQNEIFNVMASRELLTEYPQLQQRGDVINYALRQVQNQNPGLGRDATLEKTHEFIKKNIGLARKLENTKHDHIPKEKVPGSGPSARAKGGAATSRSSRSGNGPVSERGRLGLA